jgi:NTP pyrophosphatase (non-canonical NTP hydrolase)
MNSDTPRDGTHRNNIALRDLQEFIHKMYYDKDAARGADATFLWFTEEVGELAAAIRNGSCQELQEEFADVLAWLVTLANIKNIDLTQALADKYGSGCPGCGKLTCQCPDSEKP